MAKPMPPEGLSAAGRNEWMAVWKRVRVQPEAEVRAWDDGKPVRITAAVKTTGIWGAEFANYDDGAGMFPGIAKLALTAGMSERTTGLALAGICRLGFLWRYLDGSAQGRRGLASEYRLTIPADVLDRVPLLTPELETPDYQVRSDHLISDHLISVQEHPNSATGTPELSSPHPALPSTTTPHIGVAAINSNVEVTGNGAAPVDNRDIGDGTCGACRRVISVMRAGAGLRVHKDGRGRRCRGSLSQPVEAAAS